MFSIKFNKVFLHLQTSGEPVSAGTVSPCLLACGLLKLCFDRVLEIFESGGNHLLDEPHLGIVQFSRPVHGSLQLLNDARLALRIRPRLVLLGAALVDLRCEQVISLAVVRPLVRIRKQVEVFANELCELLVHLALCLRLDVCKRIRDDGDEQVQHDHNQVEGCESEHDVDYREAGFAKLARVEAAERELEHLHDGADVGALRKHFLALLSLVVLGQNEERSTESQHRKGQNHQEDLHVDYDLDDRFDQMAEIPEDPEEVEELKPDEEGGHRIQVPDPEQVIALLARHEHGRLESQR